MAVFSSEREQSPIFIAEAKKHGRPVDLTVAGLTIALVQDIGGVPTVMVSTAGFSAAARNHLAFENIDHLTITLTEAMALRWIPELETRFAIDRSYKIASGELVEALRISNAEPFNDADIAYEEWLAVIDTGLTVYNTETLSVLDNLASQGYDDGLRFNAIRILDEEGKLTSSRIEELLIKEDDMETVEFLRECLDRR